MYFLHLSPILSLAAPMALRVLVVLLLLIDASYDFYMVGLGVESIPTV